MRSQIILCRRSIYLALLVFSYGLLLAHFGNGAIAKDYSNLTMEKIEKLPKKEQHQIPMHLMFDLMEKKEIADGKKSSLPKSARIAIMETELLRLGYYYSPMTGKPSVQLKSAIMGFQKAIKSKATGILLLGEWEQLTKAINLSEPPKIYLTSKHINSHQQFGIVSAEGTWTFQNEKMAHPLQTSKIRCRKRTGVCQVITAGMATR